MGEILKRVFDTIHSALISGLKRNLDQITFTQMPGSPFKRC